ncbi:MAG: putative dsRNA-binding protein, partial [Patescibacteria group bacterium]
DTFEAVLGSLYLDSGLKTCQEYLLAVFPDSELTADLDIKDPKSKLQEIAQSKNLGTPIYEIVSSIGPDHAREFEVAAIVGGNRLSIGKGSSKQRAEIEAARIALMTFASDSGKI